MRFIFGLSVFTQVAFAQFSVEKSSDIFFPVEAKQLLFAQQNFPAFWWNFAVVEHASQKWDLIRNYCQKLNTQKPLIERAECEFNPANYLEIIKDWARDLPLREPRWKNELLKTRLNESLAQVSVIMGNSAMTEISLSDPLQTWRDLKTKAEERIKVPFPRENGVFYDKESDRAIIPILFGLPPSKTDNVEAFRAEFPDLLLVGPHNSFYENESVVVKDVKVISAIGSLILLGFAAFLYLSKRGRAVLLIPPVLLAIYLSSVITSYFFGGTIHGLTLAFGSGIIGLTLDYGLHGALNHNSKNTWVSNTIGFLTTTAGLIVLGFSSIPLLQQIALFSVLGLGFGMVFYYFLLKQFPEKFVIAPFNIDPKARKLTVLWLAALIGIALVGSFRLTPSLNLQRFNFESEATKNITQWVREKMDLHPPLMRFHQPQGVLAEAEKELVWAVEHSIKVENTARYLPSKLSEKSNLATWTNCPQGHELFSGYLKELCNPTHSLVDLSKAWPKYISHLQGSGLSLSLWLTQNSDQDNLVKSQFPDAKSLTEILLTLPQTLQRELRWMVPTALLLVSLIILGFYRSIGSLFFAVLPFVSGLGMVFAVCLALQRDLTFITVIGLVMVFGFSIDYGIFMTDIYRESDEQESSSNVVTALSFAALLNLVGFAPLLFANHPVLKDLGIALFFGTLGSYLGSVWGIPAIMQTLALSSKKI